MFPAPEPIQSRKLFVQGFLSQMVSSVRIMTFDHNAALIFGRSAAEVANHTKGSLSSFVNKREDSGVGYTIGRNETGFNVLSRGLLRRPRMSITEYVHACVNKSEEEFGWPQNLIRCIR